MVVNEMNDRMNTNVMEYFEKIWLLFVIKGDTDIQWSDAIKKW